MSTHNIHFCGEMRNIIMFWLKKCLNWSYGSYLVVLSGSGPSCSKLMTLLVNDSLKFASSDTQIC